jgi:hypothetical protein
MVSVLAIGPKVRGFKPNHDDGFLRATKICNTPSFGGEVKPLGPGRKNLRYVRTHFEVLKKTVRRLNPLFTSPSPCSFANRLICR